MPETEKRLQFLQTLLDHKKVSKPELAHMLGVSPQNIFAYFKRDDMRLSNATQIAEKLGFGLTFRMVPQKRKAAHAIIEVESLLSEEAGSAKLSRLAFLSLALSANGIDKKDLAEKIGLAYTGVQRWFKVDDISISYLFRIAELYNFKLNIKAEKLPSVPEVSTLVLR